MEEKNEVNLYELSIEDRKYILTKMLEITNQANGEVFNKEEIEYFVKTHCDNVNLLRDLHLVEEEIALKIAQFTANIKEQASKANEGIDKIAGQTAHDKDSQENILELIMKYFESANGKIFGEADSHLLEKLTKDNIDNLDFALVKIPCLNNDPFMMQQFREFAAKLGVYNPNYDSKSNESDPDFGFSFEIGNTTFRINPFIQDIHKNITYYEYDHITGERIRIDVGQKNIEEFNEMNSKTDGDLEKAVPVENVDKDVNKEIDKLGVDEYGNIIEKDEQKLMKQKIKTLLPSNKTSGKVDLVIINIITGLLLLLSVFYLNR